MPKGSRADTPYSPSKPDWLEKVWMEVADEIAYEDKHSQEPFWVAEYLGWVQDYAVIEGAFKEIVMAQLDHKYLNDVLTDHTTAENIAKWIYESLAVALPWLHSIEVKETPTTNVIYGPLK